MPVASLPLHPDFHRRPATVPARPPDTSSPTRTDSMPRPDPPPTSADTWLVTLRAAGTVTLPGDGPDGVADLAEWLWLRFGDEGLVGIDEGSIGVDEAYAAGIAAGPLVIDAAAAPTDRDWIAARRTTRLDAAFASAAEASDAAAALALVPGLVVMPPRRVRAAAPEPQAPVAVAGFGWVLAPGADAPHGVPAPGPARVIIDAGCGFGTGAHPTTRLCLSALAAQAARGPLDRVFDVGAGSGILAIAAARAGARDVVAVEIDRAVHEALARNIALNGVEDRVRIAGDVAELPLARGAVAADLVFANLTAPLLVALADTLVDLVARPRGRLVVSGIRAADVDSIRVRLARAGLTEAARATDEGWQCLEFTG